MKKLEKGNMRISPSGMHDQMMFFIISGVGVDVLYIDTFSWVIDPPIRIAIDTVTITAFFLIFTGVVFTMIIALSRVYIVSTKGITVILLGIFRHLYPWERFQMVGLYPISKVIEETPGEAFMMVCSTVMLEGTAGGRINIERATFRWPQVLIFPPLTGEERMQFESLRRGEKYPKHGYCAIRSRSMSLHLIHFIIKSNLKACGAGKYLPTWRTRNPTRRNKYPG